MCNRCDILESCSFQQGSFSDLRQVFLPARRYTRRNNVWREFDQFASLDAQPSGRDSACNLCKTWRKLNQIAIFNPQHGGHLAVARASATCASKCAGSP